LAAFNPIHYVELPELSMEFIRSTTGKSPSTTGAGSAGAMSKGPFNAFPPTIDLNNALADYLLTGYDGFVTAAGHVGPKERVDHDISLLIPEVWCRMTAQERDPEFLIRNGYLEKCEDFDHQNRRVLAGRLGYRITRRFVRSYFGRVFHHPHMVISDNMLRPETQDKETFVDGMDNIVETQKRVAQLYFDDGTIELACPPLKALIHLMRNDEFEGKPLAHPDIRALFTRENLLASDWYRDRLESKQARDSQLWQRHVNYLGQFLEKSGQSSAARRLELQQLLTRTQNTLNEITAPGYLKHLQGTLGTDPAVRHHKAGG
jgi:hypothetical protein